MKRVLVSVLCLAVLLSGCATKELRRKVNDLDDRVDVLERRQGIVENDLQQKEDVSYVSTVEVEEVSRKTIPSVRSLSKKDIQRALRSAGYYGGKIDGKIGPQSKKAIKEFQADHGLKVDGVVGPKTTRALSQYLVK